MESLSRAEAARRLLVDKGAITRWCQSRRIKSTSDGRIPLAEVERIEAELEAQRRASGNRFEAAELLIEHAGDRSALLLRHALTLAQDLLRLGAEAQARGDGAPVASSELFETMRQRIAAIASVDVELAALDHVQEIARAIALSPTPRAALVAVCMRLRGMSRAEAEHAVAGLSDEQVASRLEELPQLAESAEHTAPVAGEEH